MKKKLIIQNSKLLNFSKAKRDVDFKVFYLSKYITKLAADHAGRIKKGIYLPDSI